jgi:hypothetical protein
MTQKEQGLLCRTLCSPSPCYKAPPCLLGYYESDENNWIDTDDFETDKPVSPSLIPDHPDRVNYSPDPEQQQSKSGWKGIDNESHPNPNRGANVINHCYYSLLTLRLNKLECLSKKKFQTNLIFGCMAP